MQADPLGLVDGASVYGYARQSPGRYVDPRGEDSGGMSFPTPVPPVFIPGTQQNQDFGNGAQAGWAWLLQQSHKYNPIDLAIQWCTSDAGADNCHDDYMDDMNSCSLAYGGCIRTGYLTGITRSQCFRTRLVCEENAFKSYNECIGRL